MRAAHQQLVGVVSQAVDALESATTGISDYEFSSDHTSYDESEGWRSFVADSTRISQSYSAAISSWEADIARREDQIKRRKMPQAPKV